MAIYVCADRHTVCMSVCVCVCVCMQCVCVCVWVHAVCVCVWVCAHVCACMHVSMFLIYQSGGCLQLFLHLLLTDLHAEQVFCALDSPHVVQAVSSSNEGPCIPDSRMDKADMPSPWTSQHQGIQSEGIHRINISSINVACKHTTSNVCACVCVK